MGRQFKDIPSEVMRRGAYWGGPPSPPLFCLRTKDSEHFERAQTLDEAASKFRERFPGLKLKKN